MIHAEDIYTFWTRFLPAHFLRSVLFFGLVYLIISSWALVLLNLLRAFLALRRGTLEVPSRFPPGERQ